MGASPLQQRLDRSIPTPEIPVQLPPRPRTPLREDFAPESLRRLAVEQARLLERLERVRVQDLRLRFSDSLGEQLDLFRSQLGGQFNKGMAHLSPLFVIDAKHSCSADCGVGFQRNLDLARVAASEPRFVGEAQELDVPQCGYCQPGMIMSAAALLKDNPNPSDADIDANITNICRCGTFNRVRRGIHLAADINKNSKTADSEHEEA